MLLIFFSSPGLSRLPLLDFFFCSLSKVLLRFRLSKFDQRTMEDESSNISNTEVFTPIDSTTKNQFYEQKQKCAYQYKCTISKHKLYTKRLWLAVHSNQTTGTSGLSKSPCRLVRLETITFYQKIASYKIARLFRICTGEKYYQLLNLFQALSRRDLSWFARNSYCSFY